MSYQRKTVYGSSSAFAWGRLVFTDSKAGCIRNILLQSHGVREGSIPEKYKIMGAANEARYNKILADSGIKYDQERPIKHAVAAVPSVLFSGRADFIRYLDSTVVVDELKSMDSKNKAREVLKHGNWTPENLAQLIAYMVGMQTPDGRLIYTQFEDGEPTKERAFEIVIDEAGRICVDGAPTKFTVYDQIAHLNAAARAIENNEIWERPYNWNAPFKSPCGYCPFKATCDKFDAGEIKDVQAFVMSAKEDINKLGEVKNEQQQPNAEV